MNKKIIREMLENSKDLFLKNKKLIDVFDKDFLGMELQKYLEIIIQMLELPNEDVIYFDILEYYNDKLSIDELATKFKCYKVIK